MPASPSSDVAHTQVTDHRILRRPPSASDPQVLTNSLPSLAPFPPREDSLSELRDLALAWQSIVDSGMTLAQPQAERLLRAAVAQSPSDPALLSALAYAVEKRGDDNQALTLYKKVLDLDPVSVEAATNLGVLEAKEGRVAEAVQLWQSAFHRAPGKSEIGMNLALVSCQSGKIDAARDYVLHVLQFNPDLGSAKKLLIRLNSHAPACSL